MNIKQQLGKKIKRMRQNRGLTQEKLAEMVDISLRTLSGIEIGENFVTSDTLEKIINALETDLEELFTFEHIKSQKELLKDIDLYIAKLTADREKLEIAYKFLKALTIE